MNAGSAVTLAAIALGIAFSGAPARRRRSIPALYRASARATSGRPKCPAASPRSPGRREKDGKITLFVGAASGGVWKSLDGGTTFTPVFDREPVQSIGAIALDPDASRNGLGRHRRELDAQQRFHRRRHLQIDRRRRELDERRPAQQRAHHPHHRQPEKRQSRLRLRPRETVER
jgi:hypothetical protein